MMALALAEARKGWGRTSPNPMVGAVVARGDRIVAKGFHAKAGTPHAEPVALKKAGDQARGATLYVTLEPCNHQGRTPSCTAAILSAGIRRVVIGAMDPNPHVQGGGAEFLTRRGLEVVTGVLSRECEELNVFFNKFITTGRPYVIVKSAATLDGKLATREGHARWVTGKRPERSSIASGTASTPSSWDGVRSRPTIPASTPDCPDGPKASIPFESSWTPA